MPRIAASRLVMRGLFFAALWVVLTRADPSSWLIGVPAVLLATLASIRPGSALGSSGAGTGTRPVPRGPAGSMHGLATIDLSPPSFGREPAEDRLLTRLLSICFQHFPAFLGFFLVASVRGGIDITRRLLSRSLVIAPGFLTYRTALRNPNARIFFLDLISLLPGTLSTDFAAPDRLIIHALDIHGDNYRELARLEYQVARLFCEPIGAGSL